jgi:hypothetical protein
MKSTKRKPAAVRHNYCPNGIAPAGLDKAGNVSEETAAMIRELVREVS